MTRTLPAALLLAALLAAAAAWAASMAAPPRLSSEGPVWRLSDGDLLYRFHATFREEKLFDAAADPYELKDLAGARPADLGRLRDLFLRRLRVPSLGRVPASGKEWLDMIPGYIPSVLRPSRSRPDIVVLLWDTTRADRLSAYGYGRETTPWLKSLAERGVLYEQCRAPAPWTVPSHASLFTGLLPTHHGAVDVTTPLSPAHDTLAERLRDAGYETVLVSNNALVGPEMGLDQGFDTVKMIPGLTGGPPSARATLDVLRGVMAARTRKPLFLFVNFMEPHLPYEPPEAVEKPWRPAGVPEAAVRAARTFGPPLEMLHNLGIRPAEPAVLSLLPGLYDGEIRDLDDHCSAIEGILGGGRDRLLVVTSDHGENLNEHGLLDHKLSTSEFLLHVPLVVHWPGRLDGGRRVKDQVRLQDLFPTLLEAADARNPGRPHAASLLSAPLPGRVQVSEFPPPLPFLDLMRRMAPDAPAGSLAPFRVGILAATGPEEGGRRLKWEGRRRVAEDGSTEILGERLYDLVADPGETRDLLAGPSHAPADLAAAKRLAATAEEWTAPTGR